MAEDPIVDNMKATLFRAHCPTNQLLGEFVLGMVKPDQYQEIEAHTAYCPHCRQTVAEIQAFMALSPALEAVPDQTAEKLRSMAGQVKVFVIDLLSPPAGTVAGMALQPALRGSEEEPDTRVFTVGPYLVSLSIEKDVRKLGHYNLIGDVSVIDVTGQEDFFPEWRAYLWQAEVLIQSISLGDEGAFIFEGAALGGSPFELIIGGGTAEIHLQNLQIQQS